MPKVNVNSKGKVEQADRLQTYAEELASALPPLLVAAKRVATTVSQGVHGRRRVGQGETFWQFRRYDWGDSAAAIDWRQSAKSDPVYVRETEWEAAQSVWLWRDSSASMFYRSDKNLPSKSERASLLTLALGWLLVKGGERIALMDSDMPPEAGRSAMVNLSTQLNSLDRASMAGEQMTGWPMGGHLPRHGRVVLVGDFLSPLEEISDVLRALSLEGVRGHLVQILDPSEETLPFKGRVQFEGMEGEGRLLVGRAEALREEYRQAFSIHQWGLIALARSLGWSVARHRTIDPPEQTLLALYKLLTEIIEGPLADGVGLWGDGG